MKELLFVFVLIFYPLFSNAESNMHKEKLNKWISSPGVYNCENTFWIDPGTRPGTTEGLYFYYLDGEWAKSTNVANLKGKNIFPLEGRLYSQLELQRISGSLSGKIVCKRSDGMLFQDVKYIVDISKFKTR